MQNTDDSIFEIDLKSNKFRCFPFIQNIKIIENPKDNPPILTFLFFKNVAARAVAWILRSAHEEDGSVQMLFKKTGDKIMCAAVYIIIRQVPIWDFAQEFNIEALLENEIDIVDVELFAAKDIAVFNNFVYEWLEKQGQKTTLVINGIDERSNPPTERQYIYLPVNAGLVLSSPILH